MSRSLTLLLLALLPAAIGAGCYAPVLPLPPPATPLVEAPAADGLATVSGVALEDVWVGCLNVRTEEGVFVRSDPTDGTFTLRVPAASGDALQLWQFRDFDSGGQVIDLVVP